MPGRKREKPLYDYNIYRILPEKAENFKSFLEDRRFEEIGKPNDFAYAIDQAMLTLEKCEAGMGSLTLPGDLTVSPTEFRMVLIFDGRANMVEKWEDVFSINFLIHLTELKRRLSSTDISLTIDFVYW